MVSLYFNYKIYLDHGFREMKTSTSGEAALRYVIVLHDVAMNRKAKGHRTTRTPKMTLTKHVKESMKVSIDRHRCASPINEECWC